ncbi:carboxylesterase family protein [Polaribacter sp.]|uniref:alpha/beta hydrolase n=1 Tax=Polaribacter sp. TaxID=1920175 RepID=UPI0025E7F0A1|nr:carboxylesterase family protein [Polaribacter sp.]
MKLFFIVSLFFLGNTIAQTNREKKNYKIKKRTFSYKKIKSQKNLKLDLYQPKNNNEKKPILVYVHGGGFSSGKRNDKISKYFCQEMAKQGYIVASLSYRLTMKNIGFGCNVPASLKIKAFNEGSKDIYEAVQYLISKKEKFKINEKKIILIGSSAGAETVLHLAYSKEALKNNISFAGLVAMAGAATSLKYISKETAIPTQLFHGVKDKLVPYNIAPHHYCKKTDPGYLTLYGSKAIAEKLKKLNTSYYLYTIKEGNHSWNTRPIYEARDTILDFIKDAIVNQKMLQKEVIH